jgi:hypothetical protein
MSPEVGFICPRDGEEILFAYCFRECPKRCHPLPELAAMASDRKPEPRIFHVTELYNPPKATFLARHENYFVEPESKLYVALGTAYHLLMEMGDRRLAKFGVQDMALKEQSFTVELDTPEGKAVLTGRYDRYEPDTRTLWDYKTEKAYSVKKFKAGDFNGSKHPWQLNTYRVFGAPEAERLMLSCAIKDHGYQTKMKDGLKAIEDIEVPLIEPAVIKEVVTAKLALLLRLEKNPSLLPDCAPEDLWGGRRCEEYCSVRPFCLQGMAVERKEAGRDKKDHKTRRRNAV